MRLLMAGAVIVMAASAASAQRDKVDLPIPGTQELSFSPLRVQLKPSLKTSSERLTYGRYQSPNFQYGLEYDRRQGKTFGVFANQILPAGDNARERTFVGGFLGGGDLGTVYGFQAGVKQFVGTSLGTIALAPQIVYRHSSKTSSARERVSLELGVSYLWR